MYGTFIIDPKEARPPADRRDGDGAWPATTSTFDAQGNELYTVNGIPFCYVEQPDAGQARPAGPDLSREHARVRHAQLVPPARELLPLVSDGHLADAERVHRHGRPRCRDSAASSRSRSRTPAATCSTRTRPSSPTSAGWGSSRSPSERAYGGRNAGSDPRAPSECAGLGAGGRAARPRDRRRAAVHRARRPGSLGAHRTARPRSSPSSAPSCIPARSSSRCATPGRTRSPSRRCS